MDEETYILPTFLSSFSSSSCSEKDKGTDGPSILLNECICSSIRSKNLANFLYENEKNILLHQKISGLIENEPIFQSSDRHFQSQLQRYLRGCEKGVYLMQKVHQFYVKVAGENDNNNYYLNKEKE